MASLMPHGKQQYFDSNGNPLAGGRIYTYAAGTSTPLSTYSDAAGVTPNTNPVLLNARGEASIWWGDAPYKIVVKDASDVEIYTQDNAQAPMGRADLASTDSGKGAALVGFDGGTLADFMRSKNARVVDSIAELKALDKTKFTHAYASGYYAAGDGGGGAYWYDSTDTTSADNGGTVVVATDGGRWKLTGGGSRSVHQFGAKGDGVTDDTAAIQAAVTVGDVHGHLGATYVVTTITVPSSRALRNLALKSAGGTTDLVSVVHIDGTAAAKTDIFLENVTINGNRQNHSSIVIGTEDGGRSGFRVRGSVSNLTLRNCKATYCATDGLLLFSAGAAFPAFANITIENCDFSWNRRHGISLDCARGVRFVNVTAGSNGLDLNTTDVLTHGNRGARYLDALYGNGCDAESYGAGTHVENVAFDYCTMLGNARAGLLVLPSSSGYGDANWRPFSGVSLRGGHYDAGIDALSEGYSVQFVGNGLTPGQVGIVGVTMDGVRLAKGLLCKHVQRANIGCYIENTNGSYHAAVIDAFDIWLDAMTPQTLAVYEANATLAKTNQFYSTTAPALSVLSGAGNIVSQTTALLSSSKESGQIYRIEAEIGLTGADPLASAIFSIASGGRTTLWVSVTAVSNNDGVPEAIHYRPFASSLFFKPGGLETFNMTVIVSVL